MSLVETNTVVLCSGQCGWCGAYSGLVGGRGGRWPAWSGLVGGRGGRWPVWSGLVGGWVDWGGSLLGGTTAHLAKHWVKQHHGEFLNTPPSQKPAWDAPRNPKTKAASQSQLGRISVLVVGVVGGKPGRFWSVVGVVGCGPVQVWSVAGLVGGKAFSVVPPPTAQTTDHRVSLYK